MRIAKYISNSGLCSRRDAEKLIYKKKVYINGLLCESPAIKVSIEDKILVNSKIIEIINKV
ncbi:uncharacterized protein METZ01_LOCUS373861, partial [marine metagenome]